MADQQQSASNAPAEKHAAPPRGSKRILHRICIQCNQVFAVTPENFDAKQCSNCHKG